MFGLFLKTSINTSTVSLIHTQTWYLSEILKSVTLIKIFQREKDEMSKLGKIIKMPKIWLNNKEKPRLTCFKPIIKSTDFMSKKFENTLMNKTFFA